MLVQEDRRFPLPHVCCFIIALLSRVDVEKPRCLISLVMAGEPLDLPHPPKLLAVDLGLLLWRTTHLLKDLVPLARMILPLPRGNGTGPGGNMCLDDQLHESKVLVEMNIILEHMVSPEEEGQLLLLFF